MQILVNFNIARQGRPDTILRFLLCRFLIWITNGNENEIYTVLTAFWKIDNKEHTWPFHIYTETEPKPNRKNKMP